MWVEIETNQCRVEEKVMSPAASWSSSSHHHLQYIDIRHHGFWKYGRSWWPPVAIHPSSNISITEAGSSSTSLWWTLSHWNANVTVKDLFELNLPKRDRKLWISVQPHSLSEYRIRAPHKIIFHWLLWSSEMAVFIFMLCGESAQIPSGGDQTVNSFFP